MGLVRSGDPQTSHEAAEPDFKARRNKLWSVMASFALQGITRSELEQLGYDLQTYSPRFSELVREGRAIVATFERVSVNPKNTRKGILQQVYIAVPKDCEDLFI